MRERDVEKYLVEKIRKLGGRAYKWTSPSQRGVPDRLCVLPGGRAVAVEVKRPGGKVTRMQERELAQLNTLGLQAVVVDSIEAVERLVESL